MNSIAQTTLHETPARTSSSLFSLEQCQGLFDCIADTMERHQEARGRNADALRHWCFKFITTVDSEELTAEALQDPEVTESALQALDQLDNILCDPLATAFHNRDKEAGAEIDLIFYEEPVLEVIQEGDVGFEPTWSAAIAAQYRLGAQLVPTLWPATHQEMPLSPSPYNPTLSRPMQVVRDDFTREMQQIAKVARRLFSGPSARQNTRMTPPAANEALCLAAYTYATRAEELATQWWDEDAAALLKAFSEEAKSAQSALEEASLLQREQTTKKANADLELVLKQIRDAEVMCKEEIEKELELIAAEIAKKAALGEEVGALAAEYQRLYARGSSLSTALLQKAEEKRSQALLHLQAAEAAVVTTPAEEYPLMSARERALEEKILRLQAEKQALRQRNSFLEEVTEQTAVRIEQESQRRLQLTEEKIEKLKKVFTAEIQRERNRVNEEIAKREALGQDITALREKNAQLTAKANALEADKGYLLSRIAEVEQRCRKNKKCRIM